MPNTKAVALLCLALGLSTVVHAQTTDSKEPVKTIKPKASSTAEVDVDLKERRSRARSLLVALSTDARNFSDPMLRARSLARIADALWQVDGEQARLLFRKAWDAAEVADQENDRKLQEEIKQVQARTGGGYAVNTPPNIRREVLRLAARRDRPLGEEFLEKLKAQKVESASTAVPGPNRLSDSMSQRLSVALELMESGALERAIELADPALTVVSREGLNFLTYLRAKNPAAADTRYSALLAASANNPQADANTVSLLSSYIFTPHLYVTFTGGGVATSQSSNEIKPADVAPELRMAFYQAGASILLRPLPQPAQPESSAAADVKYLVIKRLLPLFEQSAPLEMIESLRGHLNALNTVVTDNTRRRDEDYVNKGVRPERPAAEREQALLDRIDRAKTSAERDSFYIQLANMAANKGDMRAREFASKVEDTEVRKQIVAYMDATLALNSVDKKLTDQALELVHKGELTPLMKTYVLTQTAKIIAKTDQTRALELVDEAATEARRLEVSDPALPRALFAVANAFKVIEAKRVWDATFDAVKAANSAEGFSGEDGDLVLKFSMKGSSSVRNSDIPEFDVEGIFKDLANQDYDRAVELARGFQGEGPRAVATIAIARAVLEPKKTTASNR
jgi:hypothetical protein